MLTLDDCIAANRPCTFVVAESDVEVLQHLSNNYNPEQFTVYSSSLAGQVGLKDLMDNKFSVSPKRTQTAVDVLTSVLGTRFDRHNSKFTYHVFLSADMILNDRQTCRRVMDILSRYQMDDGFAVSLIFVSQSVFVPQELQRLSEMVFFSLPNREELSQLSDHIVKELELENDDIPSDEVVNNLPGMTKFEVEQAYLQSYSLNKKIDLGFIRDFKKGSLSKTNLLSLLESNVSFDDIGGMETLKNWIDMSYGGWTVEGRNFGLPLLKGLLLVGLPGCGKSLICKALGNRWNLPVVSFDPSRVFSSRVGDSESNMIRVLKIVEDVSPCILFVDEVEKGFAGMQSSGFSDAGVTARVIGSFLIWLQECTKPVFTVATSNNIQYLPPELISRFDETFFVNIPQFSERKDIFRIHLKRVNREPGDFGIEQLAQASENLSGREIEQVIRESLYQAYYQKKQLNTEIILGVLARKTNLLTTMAEQLRFLLKWVGFDEERQDGIRARYASPPPESKERNRIQDEIDKLIGDIEKGPS